MRVISNQELEMVSGGDLWEIISGFFSSFVIDRWLISAKYRNYRAQHV